MLSRSEIELWEFYFLKCKKNKQTYILQSLQLKKTSNSCSFLRYTLMTGQQSYLTSRISQRMISNFVWMNWRCLKTICIVQSVHKLTRQTMGCQCLTLNPKLPRQVVQLVLVAKLKILCQTAFNRHCRIITILTTTTRYIWKLKVLIKKKIQIVIGISNKSSNTSLKTFKYCSIYQMIFSEIWWQMLIWLKKLNSRIGRISRCLKSHARATINYSINSTLLTLISMRANFQMKVQCHLCTIKPNEMILFIKILLQVFYSRKRSIPFQTSI